MMHYFLFIGYFCFMCIAVTRMRFLRHALRPVWLAVFFSLHAAMGLLHTWIAFHFFPGHGDIWLFFEDSLLLKQQLLHDPVLFFRGLAAPESFNMIHSGQPVLDIQYQFIRYMHACLNLLSFDNLYINTLLFSLPVFAGTVALFRALNDTFHKPLAAAPALLLPSVVFWTSVVYKDGILYLAIGALLYCLSHGSRSAGRRLIALFLCLLLISFSRTNIFITLIPSLFFLWLTQQKMIRPGPALLCTLATAALLVTALNLVLPGSILQGIAQRQKEFLALNGRSGVQLPVLVPDMQGFIRVFPAALLNGFFEPLPGTGGKPLYLAFSAELLLIWITVLAGCVMLLRSKTASLGRYDIACLLFALPGLLMIGYIVPFAGAIVRYRCIYLPFLLAPFLRLLCDYRNGTAARLNRWISLHMMPGNCAYFPG